MPKVGNDEWLLLLPLHRAPGCHACNLGPAPGPHSAEMDLGMQWHVCVCVCVDWGVGASLGGTEEAFLSYVLPPHSPAPHPTLAHMHSPHQEQGLFVGLRCPAPLEGSSINKPSFMGWEVYWRLGAGWRWGTQQGRVEGPKGRGGCCARSLGALDIPPWGLLVGPGQPRLCF